MTKLEKALREFVEQEAKNAALGSVGDLPKQVREFREELADVQDALNQVSDELRGLISAGAAGGALEEADRIPFSSEMLKRLRDGFDLTQQELAQLLDVSPVTVTAWETGKSRPRRSNLAEIAKLRDAEQEEIDRRLGREPVPDLSGSDIKRLRKGLGLTQTALAELVGVSAAAVTSWETGKTVPSRENRRKLAELAQKPRAEIESQLSESGVLLPEEADIDAEEIRQIRNRAGLSQREMARELGVSVNSVSNWETGRTSPRRSSVKQLLELREGE